MDLRIMLLLCVCVAAKFNFLLGDLIEDAPTLGSRNAPRFLTNHSVTIAEYPEPQNHTVFFYKQDDEEMYVGGKEFVWKLNMSNNDVTENLLTTGPLECPKDVICENVVTVIQELNGVVFVCGTNGLRPHCWNLSALQNHSSQGFDGQGISPFTYSQNSISLTVEGDLYAAAPQESDGSSLQFRRKSGRRTNVRMYHSWVLEPTFIGSSWVKRENDPDNEKIYVFFREKNSDTNPEAEQWISRVARVCKVDEGGSKRFFQNMWTSFIKARLVCGFPEESLYFSRLQDIYVQHEDDWNRTRVYAIFTSSWNSTAVCIYTIGMIEEVFENSTFKGSNKAIPTPRPGHCVKNSKNLPLATVNMIKDHPEMSDWVHSVHYKAPFYVSSYNYTKITVDQVRGADDSVYNVLLLATDSSKIHKVLEAGPKPVVVSETRLPNTSTVLSMKLDSAKKKLVVGLPSSIVTVDLQWCEYGSSCEDCVLAQDPYCAWSTAASRCTAAAPGNIQKVMTGNHTVCPPKGHQTYNTSYETSTDRLDFSGEHDRYVSWSHLDESQSRSKREAQTSLSVHVVSLDVPFYLSCPIDSFHAEYHWEHGALRSPCLQMKSHCLHLIPAVTQEHYGSYKCVSREQGYEKVVKEYLLKVQETREVDSGRVPESDTGEDTRSDTGEDTRSDTGEDIRAHTPRLKNAAQSVSQCVCLTLALLFATVYL
ncbi:semaphorin-7A [Boleophthalmus pectinirostris]|uniref:semaphorin-7A n=1 Tax=Boleophthalmus pectinirostris TaxID=150288 RepID=UPI0024327263|nr:semaphorin-7A [Boleophthalmus pectinirostris]